MNKQNLIYTSTVLVFILIISFCAYLVIFTKLKMQPDKNTQPANKEKKTITTITQPQNKTDSEKKCPEDTKICFDGTILRRSLPDCELAECKNIEVAEKNGWKTWVNNEDNYSITYPPEFWPQGGHDLKNYNMSDPRYERGNPEGISIQIQKHNLSSRKDFDNVNEYREHLKTVPDVDADVATDVKLGEFISLYQYTKDGPGGAFANYMAFDGDRGIFYNILVFESGYTKNKELVKKILKTFKIL